MLVAINGKVHNSEDVKVSILFYSNEREPLAKALAQGHDIFNTYPAGTTDKDVSKNSDACRQVQEKLAALKDTIRKG